MRLFKNGLLFAGVVLALSALLASCSAGFDFSPGFVTRQVEGTVRLESGQKESKPFILVRQFHKTFIETSQGNLYRSSIDIIQPDEKGRFAIFMADEVDRLEVQFIARGYKSARADFQRTLGIGSFLYDVDLLPDPNWRNNFYFMLRPYLSGFITETRYELEEEDQMFLGEWIRNSEDLETKKGGLGQGPKP